MSRALTSLNPPRAAHRRDQSGVGEALEHLERWASETLNAAAISLFCLHPVFVLANTVMRERPGRPPRIFQHVTHFRPPQPRY